MPTVLAVIDNFYRVPLRSQS